MAYQEVEEDEGQEEESGKKKKKDKRRPYQDINQVIAGMNKKYGEGSLIQGRGAIVRVDAWPSGLYSLDYALGCGGVPRGRVIELFGQESSGKTTLTLFLAATAQKSLFPDSTIPGTAVGTSVRAIGPGNGQVVPGMRNGVVAFIDAEHAFDPTWAERIGVDCEKLIFSQPSSGEEALDIASDLVDTAQVDLIIIDSVAALTPQEELDGEVGDRQMGAQARMMSKAMRRLNSKCGEKGCTVIFINQMREKLGVMFGNPNVTPGGKALKFYASIRMEISAGEPIDTGTGGAKKRVGRLTKIKIVKNKVGPPFTRTEFNLMYGMNGLYGPDAIRSLAQAMIDAKLVDRNSSYYMYGGHKCNGFPAFADAVANDAAMRADMIAKFTDYMSSRRVALVEVTDEEFIEDAAEGE